MSNTATVRPVSIAVPLDELMADVTRRDFAYLLTVGDDGRPRVLALVPECRDGELRFHVGPGRTGGSARARPKVSMVFPPCDHDAYSLVVDGDAAVDGETVVVTPTWAVRHRPAPADPSA